MKPPTGEDTPAPAKPLVTVSTPPTPPSPTSPPGASGMSNVASSSTQTQTQTQPQPQQQPSNGNGKSYCRSTAFGTVNYRIKPPSAANPGSSSASGSNAGCFIKPSLSLNSLPPQAPPEGSEMAQNRLRIDRPYNSLKVRSSHGIFRNIKINIICD